MDIFDIFIAYVSWGDSGKIRPVLILAQQEAVVSVFKVTAQYGKKSEAVRANYFKINDWKQAGLDRQSYVDTNTVRDIPSVLFDGKSKIGRLSAADEMRFIEFMNQ